MEDVLDEIAGRPQGPQHRARRVLLRQRRRRRAARSWSPSSATSTPASWRRSRSPTGSTCGSAATAPTSRPRRRRRVRRANVPEDLPPDELTPEKARELLANPAGEETRARRRPGVRAADRGQERPLRPLRHRGPARGRAQAAEAATASLFKSMTLDTITLERRAEAAHPAARGRRRPRVRRRDHRAERPLRALPEEGHRLPVDRLRGAAAHDHARGGAGDLRPAQAARPGRGRPRPRARRRTRPAARR